VGALCALTSTAKAPVTGLGGVVGPAVGLEEDEGVADEDGDAEAPAEWPAALLPPPHPAMIAAMASRAAAILGAET
jgi:hypothetical protein